LNVVRVCAVFVLVVPVVVAGGFGVVAVGAVTLGMVIAGAVESLPELSPPQPAAPASTSTAIEAEAARLMLITNCRRGPAGGARSTGSR